MDELNSHECMAKMTALLKHLQQNKISPEPPKVWNPPYIVLGYCNAVIKQQYQIGITGAPNDGFLLHTLKTLFSAIQSTFRSPEMHSKAALWNLYLFDHPRRTWVFSKLQGLQYYFSENFRCNLTYNESENFSDSSLHHIFESENFRLPFFTKNSLPWGVKCEKLNFRKSQGIYWMIFENCTRIQRP